jgi:23S rRNA (cytosine1962-C5)-methyltransferase
MSTIRLKSGREKPINNRHPWIFSGAIAGTEGAAESGDIVEVRDSNGRFLAQGYYNPQSQIAVRLLTWDQETVIDADFWRRRLQAAIARRQALIRSPESTACRLVYAEADGLPGLIVDQYEDWLIFQSLTTGIERRKSLLVKLLDDLLSPPGIYERSDADVRGHEGLEPVTGLQSGEMPPQDLIIQENGLHFHVDVVEGHKTGFYLDQRENRRRVAPYCANKEVLNAFSYTGAFAVYAAEQGAGRITNMDTSAEALRGARENMALNGFSRENDEYIRGDAFEELRTLRDSARSFDVVILDPPKFAFSRSQLHSATRGYKDINMLGMRLLRPGGILCTFSCSGLVKEELFQKVLFGASVDVGREVRILERLGQNGDHPVLLTFPESAYLKGFICLVE